MAIQHKTYKPKKYKPGEPINVNERDEGEMYALADLVNKLGDKHNTPVPNVWLYPYLPKDSDNYLGGRAGIGAMQPGHGGQHQMWIERPSLSAILHETSHARAFDRKGMYQTPRSKTRRLLDKLFPAYSSRPRDILYGFEVAADDEARDFLSKIQDESLRNELLNNYNNFRNPAMHHYRNVTRYATGGQHLLGTLAMLGLGYGGYRWGDSLARNWGLQDKNRGWLKALGDAALRYGGAAAGGYLGGLLGGRAGFMLGGGLGCSILGKKDHNAMYKAINDEYANNEETIDKLKKYINS